MLDKNLIKELHWFNDIYMRNYCLDEDFSSVDLNLTDVYNKNICGIEMAGLNSGVKCLVP